MSETDTGTGFWRQFSARALTVVGVILIVVTILAGYLRWQVYDQETFETTAEQLIADDVIRDRVADRTAEILLENVDVEQLIADKLLEGQQALAGALAASFAVGRATRFTEALYSRPRVQDLWVATASQTGIAVGGKAYQDAIIPGGYPSPPLFIVDPGTIIFPVGKIVPPQHLLSRGKLPFLLKTEEVPQGLLDALMAERLTAHTVTQAILRMGDKRFNQIDIGDHQSIEIPVIKG